MGKGIGCLVCSFDRFIDPTKREPTEASTSSDAKKGGASSWATDGNGLLTTPLVISVYL